MAFDQSTRNRLQRFVNEARNLLTEEFTRQLQKDYGLDPNTGEVAEIAKLSDLDDSRLETARILRQVFAHYLATEAAGGRTAEAQVLERIVREQAFTVLNRLAALRMAEVRDILFESVGNGYQAKGFQLYARLAGTGLGETGDAYRGYLFSVFDEQAQGLPSLFDRYSPQGRLFPREAALLPLLALINDPEIEALWAEDETIGWIYQYFNSKEERKAMRDASQAPRNSRELAVRNQFFTPRYVVEFLVDNTLGRLWFNATGGQTSLRERCQYLLIRPDEAPPEVTKLRDPRTLKLLDPACGSMHFGLYAFDIFLEIYREAWAWELQHGPGSLDVSTQPQAALKPLSQTYEGEAAFLRDVPRLIIEHNIYGVDIDPRAAQIASLALWLRAQRAWHDAGVKAKERPLIGRGHVVAAIAPPAERELRQQFAASLDQRDAELFEKTLQLLKGLPELGVLLQVERELPNLIRQVYVGKGTGLFAAQERESWQQAEARLRVALTEFAQAAKSSYQGRLFAQDALQGLRLIDLCREVFDVVVMNPPFGEPSSESIEYVKSNYPNAFIDLLAAFIERSSALCKNGYLGALTSRACLYTKTLEKWRKNTYLPAVEIVGDLGGGVLDGAMVFACASVLKLPNSPRTNTYSIDLRKSNEPSTDLIQAIRNLSSGESNDSVYSTERVKFNKAAASRYIYNIPDSFWRWAQISKTLSTEGGSARAGSTTYDDFRFLRLAWEVSATKIGRGKKWEFFSKGGYFETYYNDVHLLLNWEHDGKEVGEFNRIGYGTDAQSRRASAYYWRSAITYPRRTIKGFSPRALPRDCIFADKGPAIFVPDGFDIAAALGLLNSEPIRALVSMQVQAGSFETGVINTVPWPSQSSLVQEVAELASDIWRRKLSVYRYSELDRWFVPPVFRGKSSVDGIWRFIQESIANNSNMVCELSRKVSNLACEIYDIPEIDYEAFEVGSPDHGVQEYLGSNNYETSLGYVIQICLGVAFGRWDVRWITGDISEIEAPDQYSPFPSNPPAMRSEDVQPFHKNDSIVVEDHGNPYDVVSCQDP